MYSHHNIKIESNTNYNFEVPNSFEIVMHERLWYAFLQIEKDTENLIKYRLVGGKIKLKPNILSK